MIIYIAKCGWMDQIFSQRAFIDAKKAEKKRGHYESQIQRCEEGVKLFYGKDGKYSKVIEKSKNSPLPFAPDFYNERELYYKGFFEKNMDIERNIGEAVMQGMAVGAWIDEMIVEE